MIKRLLLLVSAILPLEAQETLFHHVPDPKTRAGVEAVALFSQPGTGGFLPVRLTVNNPSEGDRQLFLSSSSTDSYYGGQGSESSASISITAPAGRISTHDILVPCTTVLNFGYGGSGNSQFNLSLSGSFGSTVGHLSGSYGVDQPAILLSEPLFTPNASSLDSAFMAASSSSYRGSSSSFAAKFDPRLLPEDWRAYIGYDVIAMTDADWGNASPGARTAILRWNRLGGEIVLYTLSSTSSPSSLGFEPDSAGNVHLNRSFGRVTLLPIGSDLKLDAAETLAHFTKRLRNTPSNGSIRSDFSNSWPLQGTFGQRGYNHGLFILILVAFGILVGPVNLFVFAKSGRRHRLFITTPLIALGASVLLIALIVLMDGFGGRGMRLQLMEIRPDDGEHSAYILQEQISRSGVLLGGGFQLDEPAVMTSVPLPESQWTRLTLSNNGGGMRYESRFQDGKLDLDGDWFQSRSEQGHYLRAIVPTRGRIEARNSAGAPSFLSTFDFEIKTLYYLDDSGGWWKAEKVAPGKAFTCTSADTSEATGFIADSAQQLSARSRILVHNPRGGTLTARPGHFIATTDAAPGIDTLKSIKWSDTRTIITGPIARP